MARSFIQFMFEKEPITPNAERMLRLFKDDDVAAEQLAKLSKRRNREDLEQGLHRTVKQLLADKPLGTPLCPECGRPEKLYKVDDGRRLCLDCIDDLGMIERGS